MADVYVKRSSLNKNTTRKQMARRGHKHPIIHAGQGLYAARNFRPGEHIADYRYQDGRSGAKVDWLTKTQHDARYPNPQMPGTHVLNPWGSQYYYDTAQTGGVGGRANTNPGNQNARFKGSQIHAGAKGVKKDQEVFLSYSASKSYGWQEPSFPFFRPKSQRRQ